MPAPPLPGWVPTRPARREVSAEAPEGKTQAARRDPQLRPRALREWPAAPASEAAAAQRDRARTTLARWAAGRAQGERAEPAARADRAVWRGRKLPAAGRARAE